MFYITHRIHVSEYRSFSFLSFVRHLAIMAHTHRIPVYGVLPPCALNSRLHERKIRLRALKMERSRRPEKPDDFVCYDDSDEEEEESPCSQKQILNTSYNFVDYIRSRESGVREARRFKQDFGTRHMLTHDMFKERNISLPSLNKVFCSQWLSNRQIVFGTKCNKLMVYNVVTRSLDQIPPLHGSRDNENDPLSSEQSGIHALQINPSKTLLATGAKNSNDVAIYRLPTLDPVCIGEGAHKDWIFDVCWLDDQFLVSGSRDTKLALWRVDDSLMSQRSDSGEVDDLSVPLYARAPALCVKICRSAQKVRALAFNRPGRELAALSLNGFIHVWNAELFRQNLSRKLPSAQENVCMTVQEDGSIYAIGCRSYTLLLDTRTLQSIKKIPARYTGCGIRSCSFQGSILTIGTGVGMVMFYDLRAQKYLESSINSSRTVLLKTSRGHVVSSNYQDDDLMENVHPQAKQVPAIYTHCYDASGTRLFCAGGPLPANMEGNYAGLWQ